MLFNLFLGFVIAAWVFLLWKGTSAIAPWTFMAFVFWLAVILGIWEHDLWIAALLGSPPGLLATYFLIVLLNEWLSNK